LVNQGNRRHFMRVRIDEEGNVRGSGLQASHMLSSLVSASGLLDVPPQTTLPTGTLVKVLLFED
jgi:molybdopterin biosynthesis enzyme